MRGNVETIKERLDIAEVISSYTKLEKSGSNLKARCPFHNEKTASFSVSPSRQSFYCFGCGMKGDMFNFIQEIEGVDFRGALNILAEKAGVELEYTKPEQKTEKDNLLEVLEIATSFFEKSLQENPQALEYLASRGVESETIKEWRIGYAPNEWRLLHDHLIALGVSREVILKAGLAKYSADQGEKKDNTPYDVFRGRVIFPLSDTNGRVIAFSGRALDKDTVPKYLNTPDTLLFTKGEVLYGLHKAKEEVRRKDYAVLVEGQMDLVLSHQASIRNTVASSGTAFTISHLDRLKRLSSKIILAFDGDLAGANAALKSTVLALSIGMEVKIATLPLSSDPAEVIKHNPSDWKDILRNAKPAIEYFLDRLLAEEKDSRKAGKLVEKRILPLLALLSSSIERSHFVSLISKKMGLREEVIWDDLRLVKKPEVNALAMEAREVKIDTVEPPTLREKIEDSLKELALWKSDLSGDSDELKLIEKNEQELKDRLNLMTLEEEREKLRRRLMIEGETLELLGEIQKLDQKIDECKR